MADRAYDRVSDDDRNDINWALWGLEVTNFGNVEQTRTLAQDLYASVRLGEFANPTISINEFEPRITEDALSDLAIDTPSGSKTFSEYIQSRTENAFLQGENNFGIEFIGSNGEIFDDAVLGDSSFRVVGSATILDESNVRIDLSIEHAVGHEVMNQLTVDVGPIGELGPSLNGWNPVVSGDFIAKPGISYPVITVDGAVQLSYVITTSHSVTADQTSAAAAAEIITAVQDFKNSTVMDWRSDAEYRIEVNGILPTPEFAPTPQPAQRVDIDGCFGLGTMIEMWDGTQKQIERIRVEDIVVSYDNNGKRVPGRVSDTFEHEVKILLDVHGLKITPGHVTLCGDGKFDGRHVPIIDILRSDGALVKSHGEKIRATTNCPLGSKGDQKVWAIAGEKLPNGTVNIHDKGQIRLGARYITDDGHDISLIDLIEASGGIVGEDGLIKTSANGEGAPFFWPFTEMLPKPEDYVLQRSQVTLAEIYQANEWEAVRPQTPVPAYGEAGPTISQNPAIIQAAQSNTPLSMRQTEARASVGGGQTLSRKQRRAQVAESRKSKRSKTVH